jgi:hypothetical protein
MHKQEIEFTVKGTRFRVVETDYGWVWTDLDRDVEGEAFETAAEAQQDAINYRPAADEGDRIEAAMYDRELALESRRDKFDSAMVQLGRKHSARPTNPATLISTNRLEA